MANQIVGMIGPDGKPISFFDALMGVRPTSMVAPSQLRPMSMSPTQMQQRYENMPFIPESVRGIQSPQVTQDLLEQGIGGAYDLATGEMKPGGIMGALSNLGEQFSNLSGPEAMSLISNVQGLLAQPDAPAMPTLRMPSASTGLRLPGIDLMQYYKGLL